MGMSLKKKRARASEIQARLEKLNAEINEAEERIRSRDAEKERKHRTRQVIVLGALMMGAMRADEEFHIKASKKAIEYQALKIRDAKTAKMRKALQKTMDDLYKALSNARNPNFIIPETEYEERPRAPKKHQDGKPSTTPPEPEQGSCCEESEQHDSSRIQSASGSRESGAAEDQAQTGFAPAGASPANQDND